MDEELSKKLVVDDENSMESTEPEESETIKKINKKFDAFSFKFYIPIFMGVVILLIVLSGFMGYNLGWVHCQDKCNEELAQCEPVDFIINTFQEEQNQPMFNSPQEIKVEEKIVEVEKIVYVNQTIKNCSYKPVVCNNTRLIRDLKACEARYNKLNNTDCSYEIGKLNESVAECESFLKYYQEIPEDYVWKFNTT